MKQRRIVWLLVLLLCAGCAPSADVEQPSDTTATSQQADIASYETALAFYESTLKNADTLRADPSSFDTHWQNAGAPAMFDKGHVRTAVQLGILPNLDQVNAFVQYLKYLYENDPQYQQNFSTAMQEDGMNEDLFWHTVLPVYAVESLLPMALSNQAMSDNNLPPLYEIVPHYDSSMGNPYEPRTDDADTLRLVTDYLERTAA